MFKNDKINPKRIIDSVHGMWKRVLTSERGEVDAPPAPPATPPDWKANLDVGVKDHPSLQNFKSIDDVVKSYVEVQKLIGPEKIIMPSKEADDKEWNERVFNRLGRPTDANGYVLPTDLKIPKELPISEKLIQGFKEIAHEAGILPKQFSKLYSWFMNEQIAAYNDAVTARKTSSEESVRSLRTEWGSAYDQNLALGEKVLNTFGDENTTKFLIENGLNNNSSFVKFLYNIGKGMSEDQLHGKPATLTMTPEEALAEISKMENDLKHPLHIAGHPEHKKAMEKRDMLYRMAYPSQK